MFATNYLGHHLMYKHLEPLLRSSAMARIVLTSSMVSFHTFPHKVAALLEELHGQTLSQMDFKWCGQSKLAQIVWAKKVSRELGSNSNVFVNAVHPGTVDTPMWDKAWFPEITDRIVNRLRRDFMWTAKEGALTILFFGVTIDRLKEENIRGKFYHPQAHEVINPLALDEKLQDDLWEFSEQLVANFVVAQGEPEDETNETPGVVPE